jgi:hypothetical protein
MENKNENKNLEEPTKKENEVKNLVKCIICKMEIESIEYHRHHYDDCRRKNTIRAINIRMNQTYIKDGKKYRISNKGHVFRRGARRCGEVNAIIVELYCDEDQTSFRTAFRWDTRFIVDENKNIIIN